MTNPPYTRFDNSSIPSKDPVKRFLTLAVAMHGYPSGVDQVLDDAFKGRANRQKTYLEITKAIMAS